VKAAAHAALGSRATALEAAWQAVSISPDVEGGYTIISKLQYPGVMYHHVLRHMHEFLKPRSYVEIGVDTGGSIVLAQRPTVAVGIDPNPRLATAPTTTTKIMPLPSDEYFTTRDLRADMECDSVDFSFIDGLHIFEQTLRDFINVERHSTKRTVVTIHDCLPIDRLTAERERKTSFWTGDIWKVSLCLRELRPDLDVRIIPTSPTGLCVVRGLDPTSTLLSGRLEQIYSEYVGLDVDSTRERRQAMPVIANERSAIERALTAPLHH
jgi:hypothetical protein